MNPKATPATLEEAMRKARIAASPSLIDNNRAFHQLLTEGVDVEVTDADGRPAQDKVWLIDWDRPGNNDWLAVNQFTVVEGQHQKERERRADIVTFVNGMPLAVLELKNLAAENATVKQAFKQLQTYKLQVPALFQTNAVLVASDGCEARIGSLTADWERFMAWRTVTGDELAPAGMLQLETLLKGVFERGRFLDLVRNFTVFEDDGAQIHKKLAAYHQFHAVNKAVAKTVQASRPAGDFL